MREFYVERNRPYIVMIFIQFVYAGMSLLSKAAVNEGMNPYIFVVYRQAFATAALAPLLKTNSASLTYILLDKIFLTSLCGITMSLNLYYFALNYVSATFATAITNTIPAITFILVVCLRIEKISIQQRHGIAKALGSAVGLSGALVFTFYKGPPMYSSVHSSISHNDSKSYSKEDWIKGSLLMLLANFTWSLWLIMQGAVIKEYPAKPRLTALQIFFSSILSAAWAVGHERKAEAWKLGWNVNLLFVLYCGIVVTAVSYWLQIWVVQIKGPVFTAMFSPLALLITAIFSALIFNETLHWGSACGILLLVVLYSVLWGKHKEASLEASEKHEAAGLEACEKYEAASLETGQKEKEEEEEAREEEAKGEKTLESITCQ
ncbi:unnamed protein product [Coffea canephora]|uniref:WAT1-related protein n=1 Tax=Coffea canephora TaxID=49390 RepID=A0A068UTE0_COFCA|nr:unnamed protein product [Coffea canephora]